jgi:hypothetical protein
VEVYGVSMHKKALIYRAFRTSLDVSRVRWSGIWWRRGDLNPRPSALFLRVYMHSVVY